ncbi:MCE family protein [Fodinicola acaciae]|uniref:MCE family protein n=1 Tax=Fodinicola acaciae TaxID=2681555 RepID=UPI0013D2D133|nr:MCE family protein [Fodinicola acaciae]
MKPLRERNPIVVALVGLLSLTLVGLLVFYWNNLPVVGAGTAYSAAFTEAAGLKPGDDVLVAGVKVGDVTDVALDGAQVKATFRVKNAWVGNASTVAIKIKTLLGAKYLAIDPLGTGDQDSGATIPRSRTVSPFDVVQAFNGLSETIGDIDTAKLAASFQAISTAFAGATPYVRSALTGLAALSTTIASRDAQLASLLANTRQISGTLAANNSQFQALLADGNLLLTELVKRRQAIGALLSGTQQMATQLSGLIRDNSAALGPALKSLNTVLAVLKKNQANLNQALALAGPYFRLLGNSMGSGRWLDSYVCGVVPKSYLPPGSGPATGCQPPKVGSK